MFKKVLIANRGEVALRIIRACHELGIATVAVHSDADIDSLHVRFADEDVCIGPAASAESYLSVPSILSAAQITGADAIHPGYGFLAENDRFAELCAEAGITFIGPSPDVIRRMGNKIEAKETMKAAGVPVTPGSDGALETVAEALDCANKIGYPVILKASAGGGGRGMRVARSDEDVKAVFDQARMEADKNFSSPEVYMEKYVEKARHIEIQILGDSHGNVIHLGERDCSVQRRHQKLIEESPSPAITPEQRRFIGQAAVKGAKAVGYVTAGTVEFLADGDNFYFMEMNTRIQVEHPVTEMVTGVDLLKEQIRTAAGEPINFPQKELRLRGHAMEFRVNAEDPDADFRPSAGTINTLHMPGGMGVRVDSHIYAGYQIPPYYDSLLAKLIVHGRNREETLAKAKQALSEFIVEGVPTTIPFHRRVVENSFFQKGDFYTDFVPKHMMPPKKGE